MTYTFLAIVHLSYSKSVCISPGLAIQVRTTEAKMNEEKGKGEKFQLQLFCGLKTLNSLWLEIGAASLS
jgi:hypothetical protein